MFDEKTINAYQKTTAPVELKERVMKNYQTGNAKSKNMRLYKTLQAAAACVVLILSVSAFSNGQRNQISIYMNGNLITAEPMMIGNSTDEVAMASMERSIETRICIPLEMEILSESTICVSAGEMQVFAKNSGELLFSGTEYQTKEDIAVSWYVDSQIPENGEENLLYMRVVQEGTEYILGLEYSEADGNRMLYKIYKK